jgi:hypothetical protein
VAQDDVQVVSWWPEHPTKSFFPGKLASVVLGVKNGGTEPLNVAYAMANLASPYHASMNLFNFTGAVRVGGRGKGGVAGRERHEAGARAPGERGGTQRPARLRPALPLRSAVNTGGGCTWQRQQPPAVLHHVPHSFSPSLPATPLTLQFLGDVPLGPGDETSAEYGIMFPRQLPPREFILKVTLFTTGPAGLRTHLSFNETINVIEEPTWFDTQLLGLYLIGAALAAGAGACWGLCVCV